jgi:hypothetical protein
MVWCCTSMTHSPRMRHRHTNSQKKPTVWAGGELCVCVFVCLCVCGEGEGGYQDLLVVALWDSWVHGGLLLRVSRSSCCYVQPTHLDDADCTLWPLLFRFV